MPFFGETLNRHSIDNISLVKTWAKLQDMLHIWEYSFIFHRK